MRKNDLRKFLRKRNKPNIIKIEKNIGVVKEYYGYNNEKAKVALDILTKDELKTLKEKLYKGGTK